MNEKEKNDSVLSASEGQVQAPSSEPNNAADNDFLRSLSDLRATDLKNGTDTKAPKKKRTPPQVRIRLAASILAVFLVVCALLFLLYRIVAYRKADELYTSLQNEMQQALAGNPLLMSPLTLSPSLSLTDEGEITVDTVATPQDTNTTKKVIMLQLERLQESNSDIFGWIYIPDGETEINYPLLNGSAASNEYYLSHAYDGSYNPTGSIFLDDTCVSNLDANPNSLIWGHNMDFGTPMFHHLSKYANASFWARNRYIFIYTNDYVYRYEVFSAYSAPATTTGICYFSTTDLVDAASRAEFLRLAIENSQIGTQPERMPTADDQILTLCSCVDNGERRFAVHARRMADWELIDGEDNLDDGEE